MIEMEQSQSSPQFPDVPVVQLFPSSSDSSLPTKARQCGHSHSPPHHPILPPRLSVSAAPAQPSRGSDTKSNQGAIPSDNSPSTSPPPLTVSVQMPTPCPFQHDKSSLDPRTAHSGSSTASCHLINPCGGTKAGLTGQPVTRPSSADPPKITTQFSPPSGPPPGSGNTSVCPYTSDTKLPPYEDSPKKFSDDKRLPLSEIRDELEGSNGGPVKLSLGTGKQSYIASAQKLKKICRLT